MGVALRTRLRAVSLTASMAAFLLFPRLPIPCPSLSRSSRSSVLNTGYTSMPRRISSPRIKNTFKAPADATAAKGTSLEKINRVFGDRRVSRGTRELSPNATEHEAETARRYDLINAEVESGVDLFALALLMATLRD